MSNYNNVLKFLGESIIDNIAINIEKNSHEIYNFIAEYLNITLDIEKYLVSENTKQIVARDNGTIVGAIIFNINNNKAHISYAAVSTEMRNNGINKKMLSALEEYCKNNGIIMLTSNIRAGNIASLTSRLNSGFQINHNYDLKYPDGEKKLPMFKKL